MIPSLYALEERVNQVFFGILLLDEQLAQNVLLEEELARNQKTVEAYRINGTANDADVDAVKVEILQTKQQRIQLGNNRMAYLRMLSLLTRKGTSGTNPVSTSRPLWKRMHLNSTALNSGGMKHKNRLSPYNERGCRRVTFLLLVFLRKEPTAIRDWIY